MLYLFLIADLVCAAIMFPVFFGMYEKHFSGTSSLLSCLAGLIAGVLFFPTPEAPYLTGWIIDIEWATQLIVSFGAALGTSSILSLVFSTNTRNREGAYSFDFSSIRERVNLMSD